MISFIVSAVVLVLLSIVFIVPALRKKNYAFSDEYDDLNVAIAKDRLKEIKSQLQAGEINQQTYQQLHDELESTLALDLSSIEQTKKTPPKTSEDNSEINAKNNNKLTAVILALCIPVVAAVLYSELGDFEAATGTRVAATVIPAGDNRQQMTIEEAVVKLEKRLAQEPNNADGWFMLGKTYMAMKQYHKAAAAYEKVIALESGGTGGEDPQVLLRYADALAMTEGGKLTGSAKPIVDKVIKMMPNNPTVIWMAGTAENQQGNYAKALTYWYKLQPLLSQDTGAQAQLASLVKSAEAKLPAAEIAALKKAAPQQTPPPVAQPAAGAAMTDSARVDSAGADSAMTDSGRAGDARAEIIVTVDLDPALKDKVNPGDTLFIFAKAMQGPPMPLAAVKKTAAALPLTVSLNDAMAMMPQMKLSNFEQVKISAVISKSGQPGTQVGDLFVEMSPVNVKTQEKINLIINQVK